MFAEATPSNDTFTCTTGSVGTSLRQRIITFMGKWWRGLFKSRRCTAAEHIAVYQQEGFDAVYEGLAGMRMPVVLYSEVSATTTVA